MSRRFTLPSRGRFFTSITPVENLCESVPETATNPAMLTGSLPTKMAEHKQAPALWGQTPSFSHGLLLRERQGALSAPSYPTNCAPRSFPSFFLKIISPTYWPHLDNTKRVRRNRWRIFHNQGLILRAFGYSRCCNRQVKAFENLVPWVPPSACQFRRYCQRQFCLVCLQALQEEQIPFASNKIDYFNSVPWSAKIFASEVLICSSTIIAQGWLTSSPCIFCKWTFGTYTDRHYNHYRLIAHCCAFKPFPSSEIRLRRHLG